ncbi:MAG: tRNA (N6-threonylcarbamoyladenosine(37)-N6)-methyltransferase TrmO [candidate division Zixibacteria bacterium]|nr:tRNA (N6-threonylcarbamoyladenosine(37)-N6)-methyltransferase TrmO [candidate division Zixibacteria bacterium]
METISCQPIGIIYSSFKEPKGTPIQPKRAGGAEGTIELLPQYEEGLCDLAGFSHIILLYHFHLSCGYKLKVKPYLDNTMRGLFATRAPRRPNPIGLSVVRLKRIEGGTLYISNLDIVDGTPLLDIKPYVPHFDCEEKIRVGWLEGISHKGRGTHADDRFHR